MKEINKMSHLFFQHYPFRSSSPGLILREYNKPRYEDISRIYTYSYLTEEPTLGYLKRPIEPYDKPPTSPHFHRPTCKFERVFEKKKKKKPFTMCNNFTYFLQPPRVSEAVVEVQL